ncbi:hypothetical protein [Sandaracinus amylolyticus]|uniref:Uncharacterized protein n=1 Tax=Sandaracinus amylolyticus TaxID=927083 RepID=A0A0F6YGK8_9BACT|nr:hypothetical protein [Sandaracinus amylolyticus]AKF04803.1 hypothetical protein DB32_001952 [Sandaracinus amylolyticus]
MSDGVQTRTLDADHCLATWDRVLIQVWRGPMTMENLAGLERVARSFLAEQPAGAKVSTISIIERTSPPPTDEVRKGMSRVYRDLTSSMDHAIIVPEGGGFRAAIVRGVGVALSSLSPKALPFKFVDTIRSAAVMVAPQLTPGAGGAGELEAAIERVRAKVAGVGTHR